MAKHRRLGPKQHVFVAERFTVSFFCFKGFFSFGKMVVKHLKLGDFIFAARLD